VKYFAFVFGTSFIDETISTCIAYKVSPAVQIYFVISMSVVDILLKLTSIIILITTVVIVVKKMCNKTLREHDQSRSTRRVDK
jgi:hypothetical protein